MSMTKKYIESVAYGVKLALLDTDNPDEVRVVASSIANQLERELTDFDRKRFLESCGIDNG